MTKINDDLFHDINHDLKYFDYSLLSIINEVISLEKSTYSNILSNRINVKNDLLIENILFKINNIYYDSYINGNDLEKLKIPDDISNDLNSNHKNNFNESVNRNMINNNNNSDLVTLQTINPNFLNINRDMILKQIISITNSLVYLNFRLIYKKIQKEIFL